MTDFVEMFIEVVIAVALFGPLKSYVDVASENASGTTGLLLNLVPVLYIILIVAGFAYQLKRKK